MPDDRVTLQQAARQASDWEPGVQIASLKSLALLILWALFVLVTGWGAISNGIAWLSSGPDVPWTAQPAGPLFSLDLWSCAAALLFGLVIANPFAWLNGKRLVFASIAFGVMLGRVITGSLFGYLGYVPLSSLLLFLLTPVTLMIAGIVAIGVISAVVGALFAFFVGIPVTIFNQIFEFEKSLAIFRHQQRGLAGYIARAIYWLRNEPLPQPGPDDSKGARFATDDEIRGLHAGDDPAAMAFGHYDGEPLTLKTDKHVLIMASTRSGKGVTLIIPHLLRYRGSAFVLDPKGENAKATSRQRATMLNGKVHILDPFGITGLPQSRFNPLARFTPANMEAESKALAAALFVVTDGTRDHWTAAGQQLLATVILYVYLTPDIPADKKDLPTVRTVLLGSLKPALKAMLLMDDANGLLRDLATSFLETPEREFGSIVSTAQRQTEILDNPFMVACLAASGPGEEVDFKEWHRGTMTVYLCLSAPKFPVFNRWLRLVLTSALDEMTDTLDPPDLPVCFMLDELATLGHLAAVENAVGLAAGYGIQLVTVFQDVAQMRDLYKGRWASFIGNAGVRALFNLDDFDTAEYWSKFIGGRLIESRSRQQDIYGYSTGDNVSENMRPLLSSDKIMMAFAAGKMLVLAQGAHPVVTERVPYFRDQGLAGRWDDPRIPTKAPKGPVVPPTRPAAPKKAPAPRSAPPERTRPRDEQVDEQVAAAKPAPPPPQPAAPKAAATRSASAKSPDKAYWGSSYPVSYETNYGWGAKPPPQPTKPQSSAKSDKPSTPQPDRPLSYEEEYILAQQEAARGPSQPEEEQER